MPILEFLFFTAALIFLFRWLQALFCLRWAQRLPRLRRPLANRPRVSVVLAARDEEARVEQTLRHILAQEHIDLEVIPVSDRGRDRTDCILKQLALEDSRVHPKLFWSGSEHLLGSLYYWSIHREHLRVLWCRVSDFQRNPSGNCLQTTSLAVESRRVHAICLRGRLLRRAELDDRNTAPARHSMAGYILPARDAASRECVLG